MSLRPRMIVGLVAALVATLLTAPVSATADTAAEAPGEVLKAENVTPLAHVPYLGGSEVDTDGDRYLFAGQANVDEGLNRKTIAAG